MAKLQTCKAANWFDVAVHCKAVQKASEKERFSAVEILWNGSRNLRNSFPELIPSAENNLVLSQSSGAIKQMEAEERWARPLLTSLP